MSTSTSSWVVQLGGSGKLNAGSFLLKGETEAGRARLEAHSRFMVKKYVWVILLYNTWWVSTILPGPYHSMVQTPEVIGSG